VTYVNFLPAAEPTTRLRITKRGRRVLTALVALPLVIGALVAALNSGGAVATAEGASQDFTYVTLASGETLWNLAAEIAPNADPRDVVAEIVSLNNLEGPVQAGQKIALPAGY
jgi:LysM repeat protein